MGPRLIARHPRLFAVSLISTLALALAACGGGDAQAEPTPTRQAPAATATPRAASPTPTRAAERPTATAAPTRPPASPAPTTAPPASQGDVEKGRQIFQTAGCTGCHKVAGVPGAVGTTGPELSKVATVAGSRVSGLSAPAYLRQSVLQPAAFVVKGFQPVMPSGLVQGKDVDDLVAFLLTLK